MNKLWSLALPAYMHFWLNLKDKAVKNIAGLNARQWLQPLLATIISGTVSTQSHPPLKTLHVLWIDAKSNCSQLKIQFQM